MVTVDAQKRAGTPTDYKGVVRGSKWESPALTINANSFSASMHTATASPAVAAFQTDIAAVETPLGLCGNTHTGDAAALYLYKPEFTVKNVSQSSAMPCDSNNVISIIIRSNVPLCSKDCFAQITISNLRGAIADHGDIALSSLDATEKDTFAASPKGAPGFGAWDSDEETLTLHLSCCMICNKDYRISFVVRNPSCVQPAPTIFIEATNLETQVGISKTEMETSSQQLALGGAKATLGIIQPQFTVAKIAQSSSAACDDNTISLTLAVNVHMPEASTLITISGISNTQTNSSSTLAVNSMLGASNISCLNSTGVWNNTKGELIVQVVASTCYENESWVDFAGNGCAHYVTNTTWCDTADERMQPFVNVSAHARFNFGGKSAKDECCACSWPRRDEMWGCAASFVVQNPAKKLDGVVPTVESSICTDCPVTLRNMEGTVMIVSQLEFDPYIWQSSPWPCDFNTLTVSLTHLAVPLLKLCNPTVTITNLNNAVHNDGVIYVTDVSTGQTNNGTWSTSMLGDVGSVGTLTLQLSDFMAAGADQNSSSFHFSFDIINPNFAQVAPEVKVTASIQDERRLLGTDVEDNVQNMPSMVMKQPTPTVYDFMVGQNGLPVPFQTSANSSQLSAMVKNESGVIKSGDMAAVDFAGKAYTDWWFVCRTTNPAGNCVKFADDGDDRKPLSVRPIFFTKKSIGQSKAGPCSHLTVTITLETSGPLLTRCNPMLTISGLTQAVEIQAAVVSVSKERSTSRTLPSITLESQTMSAHPSCYTLLTVRQAMLCFRSRIAP